MSSPSTPVVLFGASGMLGSMILDVLAQEADFTLSATVREAELQTQLQARYATVAITVCDAETATVESLLSVIGEAQWVINAIGVIKPYIHDDNAIETERALRINSLFPHLLAKAAEKAGAKVVQIATDCVYSGIKGEYVESAAHDALDVYGKSKSLGETHSSVMAHLRCSIIGPEPKAHVSLLDWFLGQAQDATVNGFANHLWNGVTTLHYARLCKGIIRQNLSLPHLQHVIPGSTINKADLLKAFAAAYGRSDITINPMAAEKVVDRTLATENSEENAALWAAAGYAIPPTVETMISEMAQYHIQ